MTETTYDLVFRAELLPDGNAATARATLAQVLKLDDVRLQQLFSGGVVYLRRGVDRDTAVRFQSAFRQAGARLRVLPVEAAGADAAPSTAAGRPAAQPPVAAPAADEAPARKPSLAERLAAQQGPAAAGSTGQPAQGGPVGSVSGAAAASARGGADSEPDHGGLIDFVSSTGTDWAAASAAADASGRAGTLARALPASSSGRVPAGGGDVDDIEFTLAPLGTDLIDEAERELKAEVMVSVEHIDLAPPGGVIPVLHPRAAIRPTVNIPDFDVAEAGALLAELTEFVELPLDLAGYSLAPAGADLGPEPGIAPMHDVVLRLDHLKLAPVGSDLRGAPSP